jgi:hypothetical protein
MRWIYLYDPDRHHIIECYEVTAESELNCEVIKLHLLVKCRFPWGVFDSLEDDADEISGYQKGKFNIGTPRTRAMEGHFHRPR